MCLCSGSCWQHTRASRADSGDNIALASINSIVLNESNVGNEALGELSAESLALLQTTWDGVGTHSTKAVISVTGLWLACLALGHLDEESTTLDGVDEVEARWKLVGGPSTGVDGLSVTWQVVVLWEDIEEGNLADTVSGWVSLDR